MDYRTPIHDQTCAQRLFCVLLCALFLLPASFLQPAPASASAPLPEEREESNKNDNSSDESDSKDSINQINRRAADQRSPFTQSVISNSANRSAPDHSSAELKDVYQNGLGTRLRC